MVLKNCAQRVVDNEKDALGLLFWGNNNRIVCETACNLESSRSHCILTVNIEAREPGAEAVRRSKLHLVDLAGSESVKKTNAQGLLLREACNINLSLHYLEQVIVALQKDHDHVPYRNSIMTSLLRDSLGGNCDTAMIATINPHATHMSEAVATCRFAQRVAMISNCARVNESVDPSVLIARLKRELGQKERELEFYRGKDKHAGAAETGPLTESEKEYCKEKVDAFLDASEGDGIAGLPLTDPREVWGFFQQLHGYVLELRASHAQLPAQAAAPFPAQAGTTEATQMQTDLEAKESEIMYLQGMLGQRTRKNHPLRQHDPERAAEKAERAGKADKKGRKGKRYGHTVDDVASVYSSSQRDPGSPRGSVGSYQQGASPARRRRAEKSPERRRSPDLSLIHI